MMRFQSWAVLVALFVCVSPAAAQQQPLAAPSAESKDPADVLFRQANELYKKKQYEEAEAAYERAFALKKAYDIATNLAYAETKLGQNVDAAYHLSFALQYFPPSGNDEKKKIAVERMAALRQSVATLKLKEAAEGAEIVVDGKSVGRFPVLNEVFVEPGERTIEAKLAGYSDARQTIRVVAGEEREIALVPPAAPPAQVSPSETTQPAAVGPLVKRQEKPPPARQPQPSQQELEPGSSSAAVPKIVIGAGIATSAILVGTGAALAVVSNNHGAEVAIQLEALEKESGPSPCFVPWRNVSKCDEVLHLREAQERTSNASVWTFVAGGAVGVGTLIYALVRPREPSKSAMQAVPVAGNGSAGLLVRGQW